MHSQWRTHLWCQIVCFRPYSSLERMIKELTMNINRTIAQLSTVLLIAVGLTVVTTTPVTGGPVSHTDCSWAASITYSVSGGLAGNKQVAQGRNYNFTPGGYGYSSRTGRVSCDTRVHEIYMYLSLDTSNWTYYGSSTQYYGGEATIQMSILCGVVNFCRNVKNLFAESGYTWYTRIHDVIPP